MTRLSPSSPIAERLAFRTVVDKSGCWLWTGAKSAGYGVLMFKDHRLRKAHRLSWEIANGREVPPGMFVCHRCDNPGCINPAHLFLGTPRDNAQDMIAKGRRVAAVPYGENNPMAKLSDASVETIRALASEGFCKADLARAFGVAKTTVCGIVNNKSRLSAERRQQGEL